VTSTVVIQQYDSWSKKWETLRLSKVEHNDNALTIGKSFRILVDGKEIHRNGKVKA